jgi:hypothetical protein
VSELDPKPPQTGTSGLLGQVFGYIDKPWKVLAVIVLIIFGGGAYLIWDMRQMILESWLTPTSSDKPVLLVNDVPAALEKIVEESTADMVQIWAVDLNQNSQRFIAARKKDGTRPPIPEPRRLPIIVTSSDAKRLADVIAGNPVCLDIPPTGSPLARRLAEKGMKRGCAVPIPPSPIAFVGVIYLAWEEVPDQSVEDVAVGATREIAAKLVSK